MYPDGWRYRRTSFSTRQRNDSSILSPKRADTHPITKEPFSMDVKYTGWKKIDFQLKLPFISEMVRYQVLRNKYLNTYQHCLHDYTQNIQNRRGNA